MTDTANLGLPCIDAAQAQKHVTHNEALRLLDTLVQLAVSDRDLTAPPGSPAEGQRWIVKNASPSGAWAGQGDRIAAWQDGSWQFSVPQVGWLAYVTDEGALLAWTGSAWVDAITAITSLNNMALLGVGTTADTMNPFSAKLNNILWVARTVAESGDGDLRWKMSKESAGGTLSMLFQDNFSARAEIGLTGDDDFHLKVSPDGTIWYDALVVDRSTGRLTLAGFSDQAAVRGQLAAAPVDALAFSGLQLNGGMEVSQENGTSSVTLSASGSVQTRYLLDQWMAVYRGSFVAAAQQVADAPLGYGKSLKFTISTAEASLGTNDELTVVQPIEGYRVTRLALGTASAAPLVVAFWVKAHRTGTYSGAVKNTTIGGGSPRSYPFTFAVNSADTWEFKTVTISQLDTGSTWGSGTSAGLYLAIALAAGSSRVGPAAVWAGSDWSGATGTSNGVAATTDAFQITGLIVLPGVELPASDRAASIMRPFGTELVSCQRYWTKSYDYASAPGSATSNGEMAGTGHGVSSRPFVNWQFNPEMRVTPTVTVYSPVTGASGKCRNLSTGADLNAGTLAIGSRNAAVQVQDTPSNGDAITFHAAANARL